MYEHHKEPVITRTEYWFRLLRHAALAVGLLLTTLAIGVIGFKMTSTFPWINCFVDASMLLGGMGPVYCVNITSTSGKLFESFYALFCGIVFLIAMGVIIAPIIHRFLHKFHFGDN